MEVTLMKWRVYPRGEDLIVEELEGSREGRQDVLVKRQGVWYTRGLGTLRRVPDAVERVLRNWEGFANPTDPRWHVKRP
jgi:hypothetical protein